jgi:hypothetical protein
MARPPIKPVDDKLRIVLAVLRGEVSIKELTSALGDAQVELRVWRKGSGLPGFQDLKVIRADAGGRPHRAPGGQAR